LAAGAPNAHGASHAGAANAAAHAANGGASRARLIGASERLLCLRARGAQRGGHAHMRSLDRMNFLCKLAYPADLVK